MFLVVHMMNRYGSVPSSATLGTEFRTINLSISCSKREVSRGHTVIGTEELHDAMVEGTNMNSMLFDMVIVRTQHSSNSGLSSRLQIQGDNGANTTASYDQNVGHIAGIQGDPNEALVILESSYLSLSIL